MTLTVWAHYSVCVGILQADPGVIRDKQQVFRLFCHECQRVFHDRLINREDKTYFNTILSEMSSRYFSMVCVGSGWCASNHTLCTHVNM